MFGLFASTADESFCGATVLLVVFHKGVIFVAKGDVWVFRRARWFFEGPTCFGTCLSSGLQICRAGGYFFLVFRGFRRQRLASFLLLVS